ncbi:hypothetical protein ACFVH4_21130, partial [Nocardia ignorata]
TTGGYAKAGTNKNIGTDIHRHTIEFSKNTRTNIHPVKGFGEARVRTVAQSVDRTQIRKNPEHMIGQALIVLPRFPVP